ncbi:MAG TPA: glycosyltransferase [Natronosporangium sp.]
MTRVLLVPYHPTGHAEPMAMLARTLREQGNPVTVFDESEATRWRPNAPFPTSMFAAGNGGAMFRHLLVGDIADMARDIAELATATDAEVIVSDVMMPGGGLAAELTGLPWVSLSCNPIPAPDPFVAHLPDQVVKAFAPQLTRKALGLPIDDDRNLLQRISDRLHLVPTSHRFAGFPAVSEPEALVGPFVPIPPAPSTVPSGQSTIAVTTSSSAPNVPGRSAIAQDRYVTAAAEALGALPVQGRISSRPAGPAPANVQFVGRVPIDELYRDCAAVITHCGWGTVSHALVRGLPLVLVLNFPDDQVPLYAYSQPYIAERCVAAGVGVALRGDEVTSANLRAAVEKVLADPAYRAAAVRFAEEARAMSPLPTAGALIASVPAKRAHP